LLDRPDAEPEDAVDWARRLCEGLKVPPLRSYGLTDADIPVVVEKARQASSMKANPIALTNEELTDILTAAL
jgi:alcohol dehydrogenase class IV